MPSAHNGRKEGLEVSAGIGARCPEEVCWVCQAPVKAPVRAQRAVMMSRNIWLRACMAWTTCNTTCTLWVDNCRRVLFY